MTLQMVFKYYKSGARVTELSDENK